MSKWKIYTGTTLKKIPKSPGVYVIYNKDVISYIGSSENLYKRIVNHERIGPTVRDSISVKVKESKKSGEWLMDEFRLIRRLQPMYNKKYLRKLVYTRDLHVIAYIKKLTSKGYSSSKIAKMMNKAGYRDSSGRLWSYVSINSVGKNN